ncbi:MAG: EscN/YscN/HrcN family type III secretion system ATPase, partial [Pseudomonadota bacterium]
MPASSTANAQRGRHASLLSTLGRVRTVERVGRVEEAFGTLIRATGIKAAIGEQCRLRNPENNFELPAEVVGINKGQTLLTPLGALEGMSPDAQVVATGRRAVVRVGAALMGRVIDAHGEAIDNAGPLETDSAVPVYADSPAPLERPLIDTPFVTGVRALDTVLTLGRGQRIGIFA